mgnify:CR=1 FL=1|jgi:hypothetical protein
MGKADQEPKTEVKTAFYERIGDEELSPNSVKISREDLEGAWGTLSRLGRAHQITYEVDRTVNVYLVDGCLATLEMRSSGEAYPRSRRPKILIRYETPERLKTLTGILGLPIPEGV